MGGFRLALEACPSGMVVVDDQGLVVLANTAADRLFGVPEGALVGRPVDQLVPADVEGQHAGYRSVYLAHPQSRAMGTGRDLQARRADGSTFPVEVGLNPF